MAALPTPQNPTLGRFSALGATPKKGADPKPEPTPAKGSGKREK